MAKVLTKETCVSIPTETVSQIKKYITVPHI